MIVFVLAIGGLGGWEIVVIGVIVLIMFGPRKVMEFSRSVGRSVGEFKSGLRQGEETAAGDPLDPPEPESPGLGADQPPADQPPADEPPADEGPDEDPAAGTGLG